VHHGDRAEKEMEEMFLLGRTFRRNSSYTLVLGCSCVFLGRIHCVSGTQNGQLCSCYLELCVCILVPSLGSLFCRLFHQRSSHDRKTRFGLTWPCFSFLWAVDPPVSD